MTIPEIKEKAAAMIEKLTKSGEVFFSQDARLEISELAKFCRTTSLFRRLKDRGQEFSKEERVKTPEDLFLYMLDRIVNAPYDFFAVSSVILLVPLLDDKLKEEKQ